MSRSRRRTRSKLPVDPFSLQILRLSHDGRGIASIDGKIAFVAEALPGETVLARFQARHSQFDELIASHVETSSPDRVTPPCEYFQLCGGCALQHLAPNAQVVFKRESLLAQMSHATGIPIDQIPVLENITSDTLHYRRKARLAVRYVAKKGGSLVGFREKRGSFITDMNFCSVLSRPVADLIRPLRRLIDTLAARQSIPQIELAVGETGNESAVLRVALVFRHLDPLGEADLLALTAFSRQYECDIYLQPGAQDSIHKLAPDDYSNRLHYYLPGYELRMAFHPVDFTQVNAGINRKIIPLALELLSLNKDDCVLDLFCGLGNFTLPIARNCHEVVGVEGSEVMAERARENATLNRIDNARFYKADLTVPFANQDWALNGFTKILLDPPRSGALEILESLASMRASKVVYISCNPATLARDSARLIELGYRLKHLGVLDMFPHTAHVESIAEFELQDHRNKLRG